MCPPLVDLATPAARVEHAVLPVVGFWPSSSPSGGQGSDLGQASRPAA